MGKTKCEICKKKCAGDILKADDKFFHIGCFTCKTCRRPLSEVGFFEHLGAYFCPSDYHAQFGKKCPACRQFVEGNVVECMGDAYHQRCFKCTRCNKEFANGEKVTYNVSERLCQRCVSVPVAKVKPQQQAPSIDKEEPDRKEQQVAPGGPAVCSACSQLIHTGQVLLALEQQWHIWCFKCTACHSVLHGEYMAKDGQPYCIRDYNAAFGVRCYECDKYIAGRVLQAGQYQFHSYCASCARCGNNFADGEEMFMQGDEIWHARCNEQPLDKMHRSSRAVLTDGDDTQRPKYTPHFGKHLTYMYLLPEPELGYLKHPIEPTAKPPEQFHIPKAPVKIRKSRISMLKTGMQKLTEALEDDSRPRAKSPHMDNEEPIEMAHYPGGHAPEGDWVPPIERDDFPAPPFPYAVEDIKRRLSTSSVEDLDEEEDQVDGADEIKREKQAKMGGIELKKFENESSIAATIARDLEEKQKKAKLPLHWDPRSASRTASAKKMPHLRCRYETPVNASPSRYLNRPRPWQYTMGDKAATTTINYHELYPSETNTFASIQYALQQQAVAKSATLPAKAGGNQSLGGFYDEMPMYAVETPDGKVATLRTLGAYMSLSPPATLNGAQTLPAHQHMGAGGVSDVSRFLPKHPPVAQHLRSSLPDMSKPPKTYPYTELVTTNKKLPEDVDRCHLERHLTQKEFEQLFGMTPIEFYKCPDWKRINMKRKVKLF